MQKDNAKMDIWNFVDNCKNNLIHIPQYPFRAGYISISYIDCDENGKELYLEQELENAQKKYGDVSYFSYYLSDLKKWMDSWFGERHTGGDSIPNSKSWSLSDIKAMFRLWGIVDQEYLNGLSFMDIESIIRLRIKENKQSVATEQVDPDREKIKRLIQLIENFLSRYFEIEEQIRKETYLKSFFDENSKPLHLADSCLKNIVDAIEAARGVLYIKGNWGTNNIRETLDQLSSLIFDIAGELNHISGVLWLAPNLEDALASKIENPYNSKDPWDAGYEEKTTIQRLTEPRKQHERTKKAALIAEILHALELRKLAGLEQQSIQQKKVDITKKIDDLGLRDMAGEKEKAESTASTGLNDTKKLIALLRRAAEQASVEEVRIMYEVIEFLWIWISRGVPQNNSAFINAWAELYATTHDRMDKIITWLKWNNVEVASDIEKEYIEFIKFVEQEISDKPICKNLTTSFIAARGTAMAFAAKLKHIAELAKTLKVEIRGQADLDTKTEDDNQHSDDFLSVKWYGQSYTFNKTQAQCIKVLWEEWEKGCPTISEKTIGDNIGSSCDNYRLVSTFRSNGNYHPAWNTMIQGGRGKYRLDKPPQKN